MHCDCNKLEMSFDGNPFLPYEGSVNDRDYECTCGQRWWQYNGFYHLWGRVNNDDTWENIKTGCNQAISIGNPCANVSKLLDEMGESPAE